MTEQARHNKEDEIFTVNRAFMGLLMGFGAIYGIWYLSGLLGVLARMMG